MSCICGFAAVSMLNIIIIFMIVFLIVVFTMNSADKTYTFSSVRSTPKSDGYSPWHFITLSQECKNFYKILQKSMTFHAHYSTIP
jgi:hypothetical protein